MKLRKRLLQLAAFSVVISLTACGGGSQQNAKNQSEMPACGEIKEEL
jgi:uncharacterized lipoprotein YehR (DUF1307 family)